MRRRVNRLMGGGRTVLFDSFTDVDGTLLTGHPSDDGGVWSMVIPNANLATPITSNRLAPADPGAVSNSVSAAHSNRLKRHNGSVEADLIQVSATQAQTASISLAFRWRKNTSTPRTQFTLVYTLLTGTTAFNVQDSGTALSGSTVSQVLTLNQVYRMKMVFRGPVLIFYLDGVLKVRLEAPRAHRGFSVGLAPFAAANIVGYPLRLDNWLVTR